MKKMEQIELERITGGASPWLGVLVAAGIVFVAGIIEGLVHPRICET